MADEFEQVAKTYDRARRQLIPCFDAFYGKILSLIPYPPERSFKLVDLGTGTGLLAQRIADVYPKANITVIDRSEAMLAEARQRFAGTGRRVTFTGSDLAEISLPQGVDLIVSALAIHHLDDAAKRVLFGKCLQALRPGGWLINGDQVKGSTPAVEMRMRQRWLNAVRAAGVGEDDLGGALARMAHDRMAGLCEQMAWLDEAGFADVDCWFKDEMFAVYAGHRPD